MSLRSHQRPTPDAVDRVRPSRVASRARGAAAAHRALLSGAAAALAAASLLAGALPAHAAAEAGAAVTWGVRTADGPLGDARQNYVYDVDAGGTIDDAIVIANHDDAPVDLDVYAADGFTTSSGQLDVATHDVTPKTVGAWTLPAVDRVTVPAGAEVQVPFTLTVPANATPGDYAGGIITALAQPKQATGLSVDRRLGIRIHLRVGGELAPALTVDDLAVAYTGTANPVGPGSATVTYTVRNSGNVRLSAKQSVSLAGPFGLFPTSASGLEEVPELLPGETWTVAVPLDGVVPAFALTATVELDPTASGDAAEGLPALQPVTVTAGTAAVPWALLVLVVLLAGAVALWIVLARRRRTRRRTREAALVQDAVDRALRERDAADARAAAAGEPAGGAEPAAGGEPAGAAAAGDEVRATTGAPGPA